MNIGIIIIAIVAILLILIVVYVYSSQRHQADITKCGPTSCTLDTYLKVECVYDNTSKQYSWNCSGDPIFMFRGIPLWVTFTRNKDITKMPILFVFHGNSRNAVDYSNWWKEFTDASSGYIVVCPEFSTDNFPGANKYATGNVLKDGNNIDPTTNVINPIQDWTFSLIEPMFDYIKTKYNNTSLTYNAWGHSAGAQFLHRFAMAVPNRLDKIVCANSGFYTQPFRVNGKDDGGPDFLVEDVLKYPYGLVLTYTPGSKSSLGYYIVSNEKDLEVDLNTFLGKNITILLGKNDNGTIGSINGSPQPAPRNTTTSPSGGNYEHKTWWVNKIYGLNPPIDNRPDYPLWESNDIIYPNNYNDVLSNLKPQMDDSIWGDSSSSNRFSRNSRGKVYYYSMQSVAFKLSVPFNWKLIEVDNVGHDAQNMARAAYTVFDTTVNIKPQATSSNTKPDAPPDGGDEGGH